MTPSLDILALTLLAFIALIVIFLRLRFPADELATVEGDSDIFYRQHESDPATMALPVTGLSEGALFTAGDGYLPASITQLLLAKDEDAGGDADAAGLAAGLHPVPKTSADKTFIRITWALTLFILLLGLTFLLIWLLSLIE